MNREEFEADLLREGYQAFYGGMGANTAIPEHGHDKDERYIVIGGEMILPHDGKANVMRPGDVDIARPNDRHAGQVGPQGVAWIIGRRAANT
jgi:mannose-6-phosphate isomerase-like protein (cupin superfamily)